MALADPDYGHNPRYAAVTYVNYGCALIEMGRLDEAESRLMWSLRLTLEAGDDVNAGFSHHNLAEIFLRRCDPARARVHAEEALRFADRLGDPLRRAVALDMLASGQAFDDLGAAVLTWRRALEIYRSLRHRLQDSLEAWLRRLETGPDRAQVLEFDSERRCLARRMI
jgi:tetratricopeptide (TPR) repeat protein